MKRNLKALGLALVAAFALSAVLASAASAEFTSATGGATLKATALTPQVFKIYNTSPGNAEVSCNKISVTGTAPAASTELTVEPHYEECTVTDEHTGLTNQPANVTNNGCDYLFTTHAGENVHIVCPGGGSIQITPIILGAERKCLDVHAQTPTVNTVNWINGTASTGAMEVTLESEVDGITWEKTGLCAETTLEGNDAKYEGKVTITAESGGLPVDVTVNH